MKNDRIIVVATMSFVAGFVDTACFIGLFGLFTAYVTGNLSVLAAEIVRDGRKVVTRLLIIPIFLLTIAATTIYIRRHAERGHNLLRHTLLLQAALLLVAFIVAVGLGSPLYPDGPIMLIVGPLMVAAMAVQNAATRLVVRPGMPTTLMTLNLTQITIDLVDLWRGVVSHEERKTIHDRLAMRTTGVVGFFVGAAAGALGFYLASFWCLIVPLVALVALAGSNASHKLPTGAIAAQSH